MSSKSWMGYVFIVILAVLAYKYGYITDTSSQAELFTLATINLTEANTNFDKVAREVYVAFRHAGFAYLVDVPGFDPDELLKSTKWFFNQPQKTKDGLLKSAFRKTNPNNYRGYYPVKPGTHSFKEAFEMGSFEREGETVESPHTIVKPAKITKERRKMRDIVQEANIWPETGDAEMDLKFKTVMRKNYQVYTSAAKTVLQLMAVGLGYERTYFDKLYKPSQLSTFRLLHYPSRLKDEASIPDEAKDGNVRIVTGEHHDTTMLTLLATFDFDGLQIKPDGVKNWIDIRGVKTNLVVNIGALLMSMVNGELVATNHRVIDIGSDRYSVPLFYEPDFDADISRTLDGSANRFVGDYKKYGPWMTNRTSQFYEYASTDFGVAD